MAKPRVHEIASELGIDSKLAMMTLKSMGQFVKGPSSSMEPPVARRLREALIANGYGHPPFPALEGDGAKIALGFATALPRRLPNLIDFLMQDARPGPVTDVMVHAAADRWYFYVPGRAHEAIKSKAHLITSFNEEALPTPSGIVLMTQPVIGAAVPPARLIAWVVEPARLLVASMTLSANRAGNRLGVARMRPQTFYQGADGYTARGDLSAQLLAALWSVVPERIPSTAKTGDRAAMPRTAGVPSEETQVIYATRMIFGAGTGAKNGEGRARTGRWNVRGHSRNQWQPSTQDHKRIWIEEHTAGAAEGELKHCDKVYLIAPLIKREDD